ncbi:MAG: branched-chain amino acid ABC transporter permease [Deltaproteobacteria bacterium]|nr:branched-chain amino acid ABC transporter permease [Deltaproteobacteria bacterium]
MFLQQLVNGLIIGTMYSVVGVGFTLIFGIMRILNFAYGEFYMLASYGAFLAYSELNLPLWVVLPSMMMVLFGIGALTEKSLVKPVRQRTPDWSVPVIMVTLGLQIVLQNLVLIIGGGTFRGVTTYLKGSLNLGWVVVSYERLLILGVSVILLLVTCLLIQRTKFGLSMLAVSQNRDGALLSGINLQRVYTLSFGLSAALVAVPGVMLMPLLYVYPTVGQVPIMKAFAVTLLGGMGNIEGAILGGILLGISETMASAYVSPLMKDGVAFAFMILILIFYPAGIGPYLQQMHQKVVHR